MVCDLFGFVIDTADDIICELTEGLTLWDDTYLVLELLDCLILLLIIIFVFLKLGIRIRLIDGAYKMFLIKIVTFCKLLDI